MAYTQAKQLNLGAVNPVSGMCLANVRKAFGIDSKYADAISAWRGSGSKHAGEMPPKGVAVAVFFDAAPVNSNYGHVAPVDANGEWYTDFTSGVWNKRGQFQVAMAEALTKAKYLGWSEEINGVKVVNFVADPAPVPEPTPAPQPEPTPVVDNAPKIGDRVTTTATKDVQNGKTLLLNIINDGWSVFTEINSKGNAVLRKDGTVRCAVPVDSLRKV